jgi:hypothetical protein
MYTVGIDSSQSWCVGMDERTPGVVYLLVNGVMYVGGMVRRQAFKADNGGQSETLVPGWFTFGHYDNNGVDCECSQIIGAPKLPTPEQAMQAVKLGVTCAVIDGCVRAIRPPIPWTKTAAEIISAVL